MSDLEKRLREKLKQRQYLGHWQEGSRVRLADYNPDADCYVPARWVEVTRNGAAVGHTVGVRFIDTGERTERDAFHPIWEGPGYIR